MMDHVWDGFYTGQKHKSMFPSLIAANANYTLEYTGTQPSKMLYALDADFGQIKVRIPYWNAGSYSVSVKGKVIPYTEWDTNIGAAAELTGFKGCGENRYVGVQNILEFMLTPGCEVMIKPVDAILCNVRLKWTMDEFYKSGGTTSFADRVTAALGIHASQVKIVAVYEGSVIVDYQIQADEEDPDSVTTLRRNAQTLTNLISSDSSDLFGAPVLGSTMESTSSSSGIKASTQGDPYGQNGNA